MSSQAEDKRKNEATRRDYWWLLVVGFVLGAVVMGLIMNQRPQPASAARALSTPAPIIEIQSVDPIQLTATAIIIEATQRADAIAAGS